MALSAERERSRGSDEALKIRELALRTFRSVGKKGLLRAMRQRDMGNKAAIGEWIDGLGLSEEMRGSFSLGLRISDIMKYTMRQRRINGEPRGPVGLQIITPQGRVDIPILSAIKSK